MARRRRPQPRDGKGRYTKTGVPMWFGILVLAVLILSYVR